MTTPVTWIEKVTGLFVLLAAAFLGAVVFISARKHNVLGMAQTHVIHGWLRSGNDLKKGSKVMLYDVESGIVDALQIFDDPPERYRDCRVKVTMRIDGEFAPHLFVGTRAVVHKGPEILGGGRITLEIPTHTAEADERVPLPDGATIDVDVPLSFMEKVASLKGDVEQIKVEVVQTLKDLQKSIENVRVITDGLATGKGVAGRVLQDEGMARDLVDTVGTVKETVAELKETVKNARAATEPVAGVTRRIDEELPKVLASVERTLADVEALVANLREASGAAPEIARKADRTMADADRAIQGVERVPPIRWALPDPKPVVSEHEALPRGAAPK
jgi:ABC-type transporter Mla subunit MlaD